jgi:hypothetical protein
LADSELEYELPFKWEEASNAIAHAAAAAREPHVAARISGQHVRLRTRSFWFTPAQLYAPTFDATLERHGETTRLRGRFRLATTPRVQLTLVGLLLVGVAITTLQTAFSWGLPSGAAGVRVWLALGAMVGLALLFATVVVLGSRWSERPLRAFLQSLAITGADPMPGEPNVLSHPLFLVGAYVLVLALSALDGLSAGAYRPLFIAAVPVAVVFWYYLMRRLIRFVHRA